MMNSTSCGNLPNANALSPCLLSILYNSVLFLHVLVVGVWYWRRLNRKQRKTAHLRDSARLKSAALWQNLLLAAREHGNGDVDSSDEEIDEEDEGTNGPSIVVSVNQESETDENSPLLRRQRNRTATPVAATGPRQPVLTPRILHQHLPRYIQVVENIALTILFIIVTSLVFDFFNILARYTNAGSSKYSKRPVDPPPLQVLLLTFLPLVPWSFNMALLLKESRVLPIKPQSRRRRRHSFTRWLSSGGVGWSFQVESFWLLSLLFGFVQLYHYVVYSSVLTEPLKGYTVSIGQLATFYTRLPLNIILLGCAGVFLHYRLSGRYELLLEDVWDKLVEEEEQRFLNRNQPQSTFLPDSEKYKPPSTFADFLDKFNKLTPFIWPAGRANLHLQALIIMCVLLLVAGRVVNLLVPIAYKRLVDGLGGIDQGGTDTLSHVRAFIVSHTGIFGHVLSSETGVAHVSHIPWVDILLFVLLRFLQGGVGVLTSLQNFLWIPVGQFTTREISVKMFEHMHTLSLRFHLNRKTGEILRVQDRGVSSIVSLLSSLLFNIIPTLVDIFIACAFFTLQFDLIFGFIVFLTMTLYIIFTVVLTEWRTKYRRMANLLDNAMEAKAVDSLLNFETVKYYGAEDFEVNQYTDAVKEYQKADLQSSVSLSILNTAQNITIQAGLLAGCLLCAKRIVIDESMTVGDFVLYLSYITQLYGPLNWFGTYYRVIQKNFVDMEKMLDLFAEPIEVQDSPDARPLVVQRGQVSFENVSFFYDSRMPTLHNVSFTIKPGETVALVGPSGSGKSTILRLLFRFYDVQEGRILLDGQDLRTVTQKSLRSAIGVVPQDTVLFNDTIKYNIRYGRPGASDAEVEAAARAAQIHEKILGFPEKYETKVGERGLKLSGGEKQRVAIARTLLKNPAIVLLDEATSALDTQTERQIQQALQQMTQNRTTLVIAHRLSTVVNADQILVLKEGRIVERGNHEQLMRNTNGVYFDMWMKQLRDDELSRLQELQRQKDLATPSMFSDSHEQTPNHTNGNGVQIPRNQAHSLFLGAVGHPAPQEPEILHQIKTDTPVNVAVDPPTGVDVGTMAENSNKTYRSENEENGTNGQVANAKKKKKSHKK